MAVAIGNDTVCGCNQTRDCVTEANILIAWGTFKLRCMHDVTACGEDLQAAYQLCQEGGYLQV